MYLCLAVIRDTISGQKANGSFKFIVISSRGGGVPIMGSGTTEIKRLLTNKLFVHWNKFS